MKSVFENRKKRSREEIIASILFSAKRGSSKTGIMYANYLSFSQLNKYLSFGLKAKILFISDDGRYFTTTKGLEYLSCFEQVHNIENSALAKRKALTEILSSEE
ncbi:MAG: putative transcriptional regulator [Candidatus Nitrosomirales archaeon]|jgi:predicted transcriptional regulator